MASVGVIESVWRYPVKSMAGETLPTVFVGYPGIYADRLYAIHNAAGRQRFPYLTARDNAEMVRYRPRFRHPDRAGLPPNMADAHGLTPLHGSDDDLALEVASPSGDTWRIDDPGLLVALAPDAAALSLIHSHRAITDCRPVSLISLGTARQIGEEAGAACDIRRFRANLCATLHDGAGFAEDALVGRTLRIGPTVQIAVLGVDARCKMITIDPDTAEEDPAFLRTVARNHGGNAGVYAAVLTEGVVSAGDTIDVLD